MAWGISISQDDEGHVYCPDAKWETFSEDYDECPPSSYEFIRDYMDDNHHSEIDMARDEGSAELAHEECCSAFYSAKDAYLDLDDDERQDMSDLWIKKTNDELSKIVVDNDATEEARLRIEELLTQIGELEGELRKKQKIMRPFHRRNNLQRQLEKELKT